MTKGEDKLNSLLHVELLVLTAAPGGHVKPTEVGLEQELDHLRIGCVVKALPGNGILCAGH